MKLRALAPAKVNLSLFLGGTRDDGRHRLVTVFQSLSLADELTAEVLDAGADEVVCPGIDGENLATRALAALRARGWDGPPVRITIVKRIPVAAGMAGGSADAAATLRLAMAIAPGRPEEVDAVAASLGADVPAQLLPGVSIGTGAGEIVEHFEALVEHAYVVVPSTQQLSTPDVYREADRLGLGRSDPELASLYLRLLHTVEVEAIEAAVPLPPDLIVNDLEPAAVSLCPSIAETLAAVRETGAHQAMVSGSGPTVVGIWWGPGSAEQAAEAAGRLAGTHPNAVAVTPVSSDFAMPGLL